MALMNVLHEIPPPFWVAAMVFGFVWHWPIGLIVLAWLVATGRIGGRRYMMQAADGSAPQQPWQGMGWGPAQGFRGWKWGGNGSVGPSGSTPNSAFDEYRAETLRRLEEEHKEFLEYLERLRKARDKAEFDAFMAARRQPPMTQP